MADAVGMTWVGAAVLVWAVVAGLALGGFIFGGLWWTVRRAAGSRRPALLFVGSFVLRMGAVLLGFHAVADGRWQRLVGCVLGLVVARHLVLQITRRSAAPTIMRRPAAPQIMHRSATPPEHLTQEAAHAPQPR